MSNLQQILTLHGKTFTMLTPCTARVNGNAVVVGLGAWLDQVVSLDDSGRCEVRTFEEGSDVEVDFEEYDSLTDWLGY